MNKSNRMNGLYTGLMAVVLGAGGCGREMRTPSNMDYEPTTAPAVGLPSEVTTQSSHAVQPPMHPFIKGLMRGEYGEHLSTVESAEASTGKALSFRGVFPDSGIYRVSEARPCGEKSDVANLPAADTECQMGSALWYDPEERQYSVDVWKRHNVGTDQRPYIVTERVSYNGVGSALNWKEVQEIVVNSKKTGYSPIIVPVHNLVPKIAVAHQKVFAGTCSKLPQKMAEQKEGVQNDKVLDDLFRQHVE